MEALAERIIEKEVGASAAPPFVALLFTDIEGSTRLLEKAPAAYAQAQRKHHKILRTISSREGGKEFQEAGDGFLFAFARPDDAARAALKMQRELASASWPAETGPLRVRMALHWDRAAFRDGQYRGPAMHMAARLLGAAHGGQVVCSERSAHALEQHPARRLGTHQLRGFEKSETIYQLNGEETFPPLKATQARKHNLPVQHDALVGRVRDLSALASLLDPSSATGPRLVTVSGPGGMGKTRLALAVAHQMLAAYDHGVLFISLADATNPASIAHGLLTALDAKAENVSDPLAQAVELLDDLPTLVVMDNFEHLVTEGGAVLERFLALAPHARLLVTSRCRLGARGEHEFPLAPLAVPPEGATDGIESYEAVQLLIGRARQARADFALHATNARSVAAVCRLLDGMPLAIELAAARLQVLTVSELLDALSEDFSRLGTGGNRSLETVFAWSWGLLPPAIAEFLATVSLFRGGWTAQAATEIADLSEPRLALAYLHYLLTCSLVHATESAEGMRFAMLEPIRQMAETRLGRHREERIARHGDFYFRLLREIDKDFGTEREEKLAARLETETGNFLAALDREPNNQKRVFAAVDAHQFAFARACNRPVHAHLTTLREEGGAVKPATLARAWNAAGALDTAAENPSSARDAYRRALALFEETQDEAAAASARYNIALAAQELGDTEEANRMAKLTLEFFHQRDMPGACAVILSNLGASMRKQGRTDEALEALEEAIEIFRRLGDNSSLSRALCSLGEVHLVRGEAEASFRVLDESLGLQFRMGNSLYVPSVLAAFAALAVYSECWRTAAFFCAAARATSKKSRLALSPEDVASLQASEKSCLEQLEESLFVPETTRGAAAGSADLLEEIRLMGVFLQERPTPFQSPKS